MSTALTTGPRAPVAGRSGGGQLAGTGTLLRFVLRRDRVRLPVWLGAITLLTVASGSSFTQNYPTAQSRRGIAETLDTPAMVALSGPTRYLENYTYGAMLGHQMLYVTAIGAAIMTVLLVVRHTRLEEETGRAELVRAGVVGRHAYLAAALIAATAANLVLGAVLALSLGGLGIEDVGWAGSWLFGAAVAAVGISFAAVAALTVQLTEHGRAASGLALGALGLAYVLRAVGDVGDGTLSWLSPIGWAQQTYVYVENRWWPLLLAVGLSALLLVVAVRFSTRRDVGAGLRRGRPGPPAASDLLTRPIGFALRLHRGLLIGFGIAALLFGVSYGSIFGDLDEMLANIELADELLAQFDAPPADAFASVLLVIMAVFVAIYVVLAATRPRAEESSGRVESVLATGLSRARWLGSHLVVALVGGTAVLLLAGIGFGASAAASAGDAAQFGRYTLASLAYAPALWVTVGAAAALYGWLPRWVALTWVIPVYGFLVGYLGEILQFPEWLQNLSPFGHIPQVPAVDLVWTPLVILTLLAAGLLALGQYGFRRRDLETK
jgi:ABC-2 type transport system permease protein